MKTHLKKLLFLCLAGLFIAGLTITASAIGISSVTTNNEIAGNEAVLSVDCNDKMLWHTDYVNGPFDPPFIVTYELDGEYEITSIGLYPRQDGNLNGLPYVLDINVSDDGENFRTVEEVDWLEYSYDLQTIDLRTPVTTKYLQLEILETEGHNFASLNQLYINGAAVTFSPEAKASPAYIAESGYKSIVADNDVLSNPATAAGDRNNSKFWHTDWTDTSVTLPLSITFELDNLYSVTELTMTNRPDSAGDVINGAFIDFNIYSSLDGENFGLLEATAQVLSVGIAPHRSHLRPYGLYHIDERFVANVASVPNLVAVGKMLSIPVIPVAVSVAYDSNCLHYNFKVLSFDVK